MFNLYINFWANSLETLHHVTQVIGQISADSPRLGRLNIIGIQKYQTEKTGQS